jgi:Icc protein
MKLAWLTDIHLNFLPQAEIGEFIRRLSESPVDGLLLSGDIGEADDVAIHLNAIDIAFQRPVYFVLGNHDFYRGSIAGVRAKVQALCAVCPNLHWLPDAGVVPLTETTCLVGHDGWGDGRLGNYWGSPIELNDWVLIEEFTRFGKQARFSKLNELGDEAAGHLRKILPGALAGYRNVIVNIHVPPFREACWHGGRISDDYWLPHFTCKAVGDVLVEAMKAHPEKQMTVYCGHTHGAGEAEFLPNLRVSTGGAQYGSPQIQREIEVL